MTDHEASNLMATVVIDWIHGRLSTDDFVRRYWDTRQRLLESNVTAFTGRFGEIMDPMDGAVDSYSGDTERLKDEIDETQLRSEAIEILSRLRREMPELELPE